jgi:predicted transcriptional regulator
MKTKPGVLDLLFPEARAAVLRLLFSNTRVQRYVRELAVMSGLALRTIQEELATLSAAGVISSWSNGYHRFFKANPAHPLFSDLRNMIQKSSRLPHPRLPKHRCRRRRANKNKGRTIPAVRPRSFPLRLTE